MIPVTQAQIMPLFVNRSIRIINYLNQKMRANSKHSVQVTLSGFRKDEKYDEYISVLKKLYCQQPQVLNKYTEVLCTTTIHSEKCKIARVFKESKIKIIKKEWMYQVYNKQKRIDTKSYEVKGIFYGLKLGLFGFSTSQLDSIMEKLEQQEGFGESIDLRDTAKANTFDCVLLSRKFFELPEAVSELDIPVVTMEWYQRCIAKDEYVFPNDYAINYDILTVRSDIPKLSKCAAKAREILKKVKLNQQEYCFFQDMVFYLHKFDQKPNRETKQIITAHGGFCLDQISCFHTHILCTDYDEDDYNYFLKYGNNIKIIKLNWLFDCIITESALPEEDYLFKKYKIKISEGSLNKASSNDMNSISFNQQRNSISMSENKSLLAKKRASISFNPVEPLFSQQSNTLIQSNIFEKKKFFFYRDQYSKEHLRILIKMVKENSGSIPKLISKDEKFYLVLPDSKDNVERYKQFMNKSFTRVTKVSYRWVEFCVNYGEQVNPFQGNRFIFNPFMKSTPISFFLAVKCDMIGFNDLEQKRIKELLKIIGASCDIYKKQKITHVIVKPGKYDTLPAYFQYKEMMENNPSVNIKFIRLEWMLDNCGQIHEVPIDDYIVQ